MQQQLETLAYESSRVQKIKQVVYRVNDLEKLSATSLYYGDGSSSGSGSGFGGGFGGGRGFFETAYEKGTKKGPSGGGPKPASIGTFSEFRLSKDFNKGPGILKESLSFLERYRAGEHEKYGEDHVNLEYLSPVTGKPLINIHIDMKDKK